MDWLKILKEYVDTLETIIGTIDAATTDSLHGKLGTDTELADYSLYDLLGGNAFKTHALSAMLGALTATDNLKGILGAYTTAANLKAAIDALALEATLGTHDTDIKALLGTIDAATTDSLHGKLGTDTELADYSLYDLLGGNAFKTHALSAMLGALTATDNLKGILGAYTTAANLKAAIDALALEATLGTHDTDIKALLGTIDAVTTDSLHGKLGTDTELADYSFYDLLGGNAFKTHSLSTMLGAFTATDNLKGVLGAYTTAANLKAAIDAIAAVTAAIPDAGALTDLIADVTAILADTEVLTLAAIEGEAVDALESFDLDHLINIAHPTGDPVADSLMDLIMNKDAGQTFARATDSLEALEEAIATIDGIVDDIKTVTEALPNAGALTDLIADITSILADTEVLTLAAIEAEAVDALESFDLDHLINVAHPTGDPVADSLMDLIMNKDAGQTFARATDSLEALEEAIATIDGIVDDIKTVTEALPNAGALTDLIADITSILADTEVLTLAAIEAEVEDALQAQNLDHLMAVVMGAALDTIVLDDTVLGFLLAKADVTNFDRTTMSLEALQEAIATIDTEVGNIETKLDTPANFMADVSGLEASVGRALFTMDFWSDPQEEVQVPAAAATLVLTPTVQVAERPVGATIVRVTAMFKFRMVENTYDGANALDGATDPDTSQVIQVKETTAGAYVDAINFADNQFTLDNLTREGGDVLIGSIDIAGEVDDNGNYTFQWKMRKCDSDFINFNDVQVGLRILYSV